MLFREKGFDATTIREIAARTGLSLGATYYYFPSKESIVAAYYDHVQDQHRVRAFAAVRRSRPRSRNGCAPRITPSSM